MADLDSKLGAKASTYGWYSQITSTTYNGDQLLEVLDDVVSSGAVFQPAVMPYINFDEIDSNVASQVISVLEQFTSKGVEVWLRFGHEVNYYKVSIIVQCYPTTAHSRRLLASTKARLQLSLLPGRISTPRLHPMILLKCIGLQTWTVSLSP